VRARAAATPIVLVVLAAGAAAYAYLVDRGSVSDADRAARRRDVFPSFRVEEVTRVELEHGEEALVLERVADAGPGASTAWVITSPRRERADGAAIDLLLRELELATRLREVEGSVPLGLETPRARGAVKVGALEYRFAVGADAPRAGGGAYMRVDGQAIFVVGLSLKSQLLRGADSYRDHTLVALGANEVARLEVRARDGSGFALEPEGATFRVAGAGLRASRAAVDHVFAALADARAESFLDDAEADRAMAAGITVTLSPRDADRPRVELRIGGACPGHPDDVVLVRAAPSRMSACTAKALVETLGATQESLVDASLLFAHADEIEQIRLESVTGGGPLVELARKGNGWHQRAPEDRDLDVDQSDAANDLAATLANARGLDARRAGTEDRLAARNRVTILRGGGTTSEVVELAPAAADGSVLARRIDDGAVLHLPRAVARRFEPHPVVMRPRAMWRPPFDAGAVVAVDDGCAPVPERLERKGGIWAIRAPAGFAADALSISDLTGAIAHAKVEAWIAEDDDGGFGFDRPEACTVTCTLERASGDAEMRRVSLVFGAQGGDGVYAHALGDPAVFVVSKVLRQLVSHPAVDRSPLRLDPNALTSVLLVRGTARLLLERDGDRLVRKGGDAGEAGNDERLETALAGLNPEAAIHTGPPARDEGMQRPTLEIVARAAPADGGRGETRIAIGAITPIDGADAYFVRASGIDATFVVRRGAVSAILDAW
jgi:uncharacterized protein DUF4340